MNTKNIRPLAAAILFAISCSPGNRYYNLPVTAEEQTTEDLNLVGGLPVTGGNFNSTGRFLFEENGGLNICTLTRIGPKHFLTAGHCKPQTSKIWLQNTSASAWDKAYKQYSWLNSPQSPFRFDYGPKDAEGNYQVTEPNLRTGYNRPTNAILSNKEDWGLLVLDMQWDSVDTILDNFEWLNANYKSRTIGNPGAIRNGNTLMVAGYGQGEEDDGIIATCPTPSSCTSRYVTDWDTSADNTAVDSNKKYAFFQVNTRGSIVDSKGFLFSSKAELVQTTVDGMIEYTFDQEITDLSPDPRGLVAKGDSGGPVLNAALNVIGVVSSNFSNRQDPFGFWNAFSAFPFKTVRDAIQKPEIYLAPDQVNQGTIFAVFGQNINRMSFKTTDGIGMPIAECTSSGLSQEQLTRINSIGLKLGEDYQCYKPNVPGVDRIYRFTSRLTGETIGFTNNQTGETINSIRVIGRHTICSTSMKWYASYDGVRWGVYQNGTHGWAAQGEFTATETLADTKSRSLAMATKEAESIVADGNERGGDAYYAEQCDGGVSGYPYPDKESAAIAAARPVYRLDGTFCEGSGVVHSVLYRAFFEIGKTTCISNF